MGKTFQEILGIAEIVAGTLLQFTTGGQGIGLALIASGLGTEAVAILTKTPKPPTTDEAQKQTLPARVSGYGRMRLHWAWILFETADNGTAVDVGAFHDGRIDGIEQYYLGDIRVSLENGWVKEDDSGNGQFGSNTPGQGGGVVQIGANLGETPGTAWPLVIAAVPDHWTVNHRGDGVVTGYMLSRAVKSKNFQTVYASGGPNQTPMSLAMRLQLVFDWRDSSQSVTDPTTWKWSENAVLHLAHYLMVRMARDWATCFVPTLSYWTAAADDADVSMPLSQFQTNLAVKASKDDTAAYLVSTNGLHVGMEITISVSGDHANDEVRTVTSISGTVAHWSGGLSNLHPQGSEVTWAADPANPPTEPRYRSCVIHQHTDQNKDVLAHLIACFDGFLSPNAGGALVVYSGRHIAPTVSIGPDVIVNYSYQQFVAEEDSINTLKISYVSQNHDFNTVQADDWVDNDDIAARGKILSQGLDNQVPSYTQARRLAKRALSKAMPPSQGTCTVTAAGRTVIGQRYINLNLTEAGATFINAPVEIVKWTYDLKTGGGSFDWVQADPNVDAWDPETEDGNPAPIGNRVGTQPLATPTVTNAVPDFSSVSDDGTGVRVDITAAGLNRDDVTWFARWRVQGFEAWNEQEYTDTDPSDAVQLVTSFVPTAKTVEVEVAYKVGDGRISAYSDPPYAVSTATDATPPDPATMPTVTSWTNSLDLQAPPIARARAYRWRFYDSTATTLIDSFDTPTPTFSYAYAQAAMDGIRRAYVVKLAGVNAAGEGTAILTGVLSNPAPAAVTTPAIAGGTTTATATCDASTDTDLAGYAVFYSSTSGFDPTTTGGVVTSGSPSIPIYGLAAGTYYGRVAAFDPWTANPSLLNLSAEISFTITTGGGTTPSGGGTDGGGYHGVGGGGHTYLP